MFVGVDACRPRGGRLSPPCQTLVAPDDDEDDDDGDDDDDDDDDDSLGQAPNSDGDALDTAASTSAELKQ